MDQDRLENQIQRRPFKAMLLTYATTIMLSSLNEVKGSLLYSAKLEKLLDEYSRTKLSHVYANGEVADQSLNGSVMIEKLAYAITCISNQPEDVKSRFDRELEGMMIRYGVNMIELEKL